MSQNANGPADRPRGATVTVPCGTCRTFTRYDLFTPDDSELPGCRGCGAPYDREKLKKTRLAYEAFRADPVRQAAIERIRAAVDRGENPFPAEKEED